jgi:hypothetical protein
MEDDLSYINAGAKRSASYIPISMWNQDNNMLMRICRKRDSLKDRERKLENKIDVLRSEVKDLETSLQAQSKTPLYTAVTVMDTVFTYRLCNPFISNTSLFYLLLRYLQLLSSYNLCSKR